MLGGSYCSGGLHVPINIPPFPVYSKQLHVHGNKLGRQAAITCICNNWARQQRILANSGWSAPELVFSISIALRYNTSASLYLAYGQVPAA